MAETTHIEEMTARLDNVKRHNINTWLKDCSPPDWLNIVLQLAQIAQMQWQSVDLLWNFLLCLIWSISFKLVMVWAAYQQCKDSITLSLAPFMLENLATSITTDFPKSTLDN